jgi:hypothetical protein
MQRARLARGFHFPHVKQNGVPNISIAIQSHFAVPSSSTLSSRSPPNEEDESTIEFL